MCNITNLSVCVWVSQTCRMKNNIKKSLLWRKWFIKSSHQILYVLQVIHRILNNVFQWRRFLLGLGFLSVIVRHWTCLSAPWFGHLRLRIWTARRSGREQVLARGDRGGDQIRVESQPRPRAAETVVCCQRRGCRTGGESWSNCSLCCHVWIEQSSKGWQWDSLCKKKKELIFPILHFLIFQHFHVQPCKTLFTKKLGCCVKCK